MEIETKYGNVELSIVTDMDGQFYADYDLEVIPEALQKHIDEIILVNKQTAFERRKEKLRRRGYRTLEELEKKNPMEVEAPYIGVSLDLRGKQLNGELNVHGYDTETKGVCLEFHYTESLVIDPRMILELLLTAVRKSAPSEQTIDPVPNIMY